MIVLGLTILLSRAPDKADQQLRVEKRNGVTCLKPLVPKTIREKRNLRIGDKAETTLSYLCPCKARIGMDFGKILDAPLPNTVNTTVFGM